MLAAQAQICIARGCNSGGHATAVGDGDNLHFSRGPWLTMAKELTVRSSFVHLLNAAIALFFYPTHCLRLGGSQKTDAKES